MKFRHVRVELAEANAFVAKHHRHHKPVVGHLFSIGAALGGRNDPWVGGFYRTRDEANEANDARLRIACIEIDCEEGQGLA